VREGVIAFAALMPARLAVGFRFGLDGSQFSPLVFRQERTQTQLRQKSQWHREADGAPEESELMDVMLAPCPMARVSGF